MALRRMLVDVADQALEYGNGARVRLLTNGPRTAIADFEVDEDGPGIPESLQQRVFDPFSVPRVRATAKLGLWLATVPASALDHGGRVERHNHREGGLCVIVSLPLPGR